MWGNLKTFTSEVLETAKDLKAHIHEITTEDYSPDSEAERSSTVMDIGNQHLYSLEMKVKALTGELQIVKDSYNHDIARLSETITELRTQLAATEQARDSSESEKDWLFQQYQEQKGDILRAKSLLQREVEQLLEDNRQVPGLQEETRRLTIECDRLRKELELTKEELEGEKGRNKQLRVELEKEHEHQEEHVDRAFFLQFLEMYTKNLANFRIREEMLESLVTQLALSPHEQSRLGIEPKPAEIKLPKGLQGSIFDSFKQFLLDE